MGLFKRLFCRHPNLEFVRNLYGDEIVDWGWKRSVWSCKRCDAAIGKDELHAAPQPEAQPTEAAQPTDWRAAFDVWWSENRVKTHNLRSAEGFSRKAFHAGVLAAQKGGV